MENEGQGQRIYHEKQRLQFCLLHALNNLFQVVDLFPFSCRNILNTPVRLIFSNYPELFGDLEVRNDKE